MLKQNYIAVTVAVLAGFAALPLAAQQRAEQRTPPRLEITMTLLPEKAKDATEDAAAKAKESFERTKPTAVEKVKELTAKAKEAGSDAADKVRAALPGATATPKPR